MKKKIYLSSVLVFVLAFFSNALAYQLTFTPRTSTSIEYTDNIFLSDENKEDELITVVSAGFTLGLIERNVGLELAYDPSYAFYNDFDENDGWRHNARLWIWSDLARNTRLEFTNRFLLTEDPLGEEDLIIDDEVVIPGDTTVRRTREEYYTNTAIIRLSHQFGPNDSVYAQFLNSFLRNDDPTVEDNDRYEPSLGLTYWFTDRTGLETMGVYTRGKFSQDTGFGGTPSDDFDNWFGSLKLMQLIARNLSLYAQYDHAYRKYDGDLENDYNLYSPSVGFQYGIAQDMQFALGLGYFYQDIDDEDNEEGFYGSGEIRKSWNYRRGAITLLGAAGIDQNDFGAQRLGVERFASVRADAQYEFTRDLSGNIFGNFRYSDPVNVDESRGIEDQQQYQGGVGLIYFPLRWMALNLNYQFTKYDESREGVGSIEDDYEENRVMFTITLQPDQPWRYTGI